MSPPEARRPVDEPASAELALVDPALRRQLIEAEQARATAEPPVDTVTVSRRPESPEPRSRRRLLAAAAGCFVATVVVLLVVWVLRTPAVDVGRTAAISSARKHAVTPAGFKPAPRLVWAPVAGVTEYELAVYRGSTRLFRTRTREASATVPQLRSLAAGTYEWYVWVVRHGVPDRVAVVRSRLRIPAN
jgi:hypothetical protein